MLVLSRKLGEKIQIGDNVTITVVRLAQGTVRLGIDAPLDLAVVRDEIKQPAQGNSASTVSSAHSATAAASLAGR